MTFHAYLTPQARGTVAFPREMRKAMHLDEPGTQLEVTERDDGVFELRPVLPIPADQQWFWTDAWQAREREADADIASGRVQSFDDTESFLAHLENIDAEP